jgi:transcriptional regulator with XRE-family HTH domain
VGKYARIGTFTHLPQMCDKAKIAGMENNKNNLRDIRVSLGLKQTDVAQMLGHASPDRISHWEKGVAFPGVVNLFKLSLTYRVPPEQLYADLYTSLAGELEQKNGSESEFRFESKTRLEEGSWTTT